MNYQIGDTYNHGGWMVIIKDIVENPYSWRLTIYCPISGHLTWIYIHKAVA